MRNLQEKCFLQEFIIGKSYIFSSFKNSRDSLHNFSTSLSGYFSYCLQSKIPVDSLFLVVYCKARGGISKLFSFLVNKFAFMIIELNIKQKVVEAETWDRVYPI